MRLRGTGTIELVTHEGAVDGGARGCALTELGAQLRGQGARSPGRMPTATFNQTRLDDRVHLVRTRVGTSRLRYQCFEASGGVTSQPTVQRPTINAVVLGDLGDRGS